MESKKAANNPLQNNYLYQYVYLMPYLSCIFGHGEKGKFRYQETDGGTKKVTAKGLQ